VPRLTAFAREGANLLYAGNRIADWTLKRAERNELKAVFPPVQSPKADIADYALLLF
jgi:hypothetical protein